MADEVGRSLRESIELRSFRNPRDIDGALRHMRGNPRAAACKNQRALPKRRRATPTEVALRMKRGSETGVGLTVGRDSSHLPCSPVPGLDSAGWPRATHRPHGPFMEGDLPHGGPPSAQA